MDDRELQLLPHSTLSSDRPSSSDLPPDHQSLDLQLSITLVTPIQHFNINNNNNINNGHIQTLKWQAAEQIRLASLEKAYAERVRELTRREMELAQSEFARAKHVWERAREDVERAERLKERAKSRRMDDCVVEITCHSCRQRFRPYN